MSLELPKLMYLGYPGSVFSRNFIPALADLKSYRLSCVFVKEEPRNLWPQEMGMFLNLIQWLQQLLSGIRCKIAYYYWRIYGYHRSIAVYYFDSVQNDDLNELARDFDYLLTAGIQHKLKTSFISAFKNTVYNFHYALLPKYRGTFPLFWQRVNGDYDYGYTFHVLNEKIDGGDIVLQERLSVNPGYSDSTIGNLLVRHAAFQLHRLFCEPVKMIQQLDTDATTYTTKDYLKYVNIQMDSNWINKLANCRRWILNRKYLVHVIEVFECEERSGLFLKGLHLHFQAKGRTVKIIRVNYLPSVFYFWTLKSNLAKR
ncbi:MAG: hypothetical protein IPM34_02605 [Saprospiraceae bacterium]|nr:hypothetical protein [Saprospiraceae bacterium]